MGLLDKVESGPKKKPHFAIIYGTDSVGKTSFAADAPSVLIADLEGGSENLDVERVRIKSFEEMMSLVDELLTTKHKFKSLAIDSLDWLEPMVWKKVCKDHEKTDIEAFGFGKGYGLALVEWAKMIDKLRTLREHMNVILICHTQIKVFQDPTQAAGYDRYQLKLNEKAASLLREAVDYVLFANYEVFTKRDGQKTRAFGEGARLLFSQRRPGFDAKARLPIPFSFPLSWSDFNEAIDSCSRVSSESSEDAKNAISAMLSQINDMKLTEVVMKSVEAADPAKLNKIKDKLLIRIEALNA